MNKKTPLIRPPCQRCRNYPENQRNPNAQESPAGASPSRSSSSSWPHSSSKQPSYLLPGTLSSDDDSRAEDSPLAASEPSRVRKPARPESWSRPGPPPPGLSRAPAGSGSRGDAPSWVPSGSEASRSPLPLFNPLKHSKFQRRNCWDTKRRGRESLKKKKIKIRGSKKHVILPGPH